MRALRRSRRPPRPRPLMLAALLTALAATPAACAPRSAPDEVLVLDTSVGTLAIRMFPADAPRTVENIRRLVREHFYDSLTFHRIVPGFVVQGGDPNSRDENPFNDGNGGPGWTLPAEIHRPHTRGAVAMARQPDAVNPERASNGSQFYIALRDLPQLDGAYTVFGQLVSGWDTLDRLVALSELKDIARRGREANPGRHAMILRARLEPLSAWRGRLRAPPPDSAAR